jgi:hypothetical protein
MKGFELVYLDVFFLTGEQLEFDELELDKLDKLLKFDELELDKLLELDFFNLYSFSFLIFRV